MFILSYALFMFPGGWLADRFGPRLILALTSLGSALFPALTAFAGLPMLSATLGVLPSSLWVRLGFGLCTAPLYPACGRLTANWFPIASRARVQGVVLSGAALGGAITPILFSRLIAGFGWRVSLGGWLSDRLIPRWGPHLSRRRVAVAGMALSALLLYLGINITNTLTMVALLSLALGLAASAEGRFGLQPSMPVAASQVQRAVS